MYEIMGQRLLNDLQFLYTPCGFNKGEKMSFNLSAAIVSIREMIDELGWRKYHQPKYLIMAISLESAELMQKIQWREETEINQLLAENGSLHKDVSFEAADIAINLLSLCDNLNIDLNEVIIEKCRIIKNRFVQSKSKNGATSNDIRCDNCSMVIEVEWHFCPSCGVKISL